MLFCLVQDLAFFQFCNLADTVDMNEYQMNHAYHLEPVVEVEVSGLLGVADWAENHLLDHDSMLVWVLDHPENCEMVVHHLCFSWDRLGFLLALEAA